MKNIFLAIGLILPAPAFAQAPSPLQSLLTSQAQQLAEVLVPAPAAPAPAAQEGECPGWDAVVKKTLQSGVFTEADEYIPAGRGLADLSAPKGQPHTASYFNLWGAVNEEGVFVPGFATMVYEDWSLTPEGNWHVDQWLFSLDLDGTPNRVSHGFIDETPDGQVLDMHSDQLDPAGREAWEKREQLVEKWEAFTPPAR